MVNNPFCPILFRTIIIFFISASGDSFKYCSTDNGCGTISDELKFYFRIDLLSNRYQSL